MERADECIPVTGLSVFLLGLPFQRHFMVPIKRICVESMYKFDDCDGC